MLLASVAQRFIVRCVEAIFVGGYSSATANVYHFSASHRTARSDAVSGSSLCDYSSAGRQLVLGVALVEGEAWKGVR